MPTKPQVKEYAGKLAAFGDERLDAMAAAVREPKPRAQKPVGTERCPSCGNVRFLTKVHVARLCQECHDDITRLAAPGRLWE